MGRFKVRIEVGDPQATRFERLEALVDTGATNTVIPRKTLRGLGIHPGSKRRYTIADGSKVELDIGRAWVRVDGQQEFTQVAFGDDRAAAVLGAVTLEEMGLSVDPVARRLVPVDGYLMCSLGRN